MSITYTHNGNNMPVTVKLDGKTVGKIRPVSEGWQYCPTGSREGGEIFKTIKQVKESLQTETK